MRSSTDILQVKTLYRRQSSIIAFLCPWARWKAVENTEKLFFLLESDVYFCLSSILQYFTSLVELSHEEGILQFLFLVLLEFKSFEVQCLIEIFVCNLIPSL